MTVRKGKAVRISARPWYGPRTVPAMFRIIGQAIKQKVPVLNIKYDDRLGYPTQKSIAYIALAAADKMGYRLSGFRALWPCPARPNLLLQREARPFPGGPALA